MSENTNDTKAIARQEAFVGKITERIQPALQRLGMQPEQIAMEVNHAAKIIQGSDGLKRCKPESIFNALLQVAHTGLTLNPLEKEAYIIPRGEEAIFEPSYLGLRRKAQEACGAKYMVSNVVRRSDTFEPPNEFDPNSQPVHRKDPSGKSEVIGAYSLAIFPDGTKLWEYMSIDELNKVRAASDSYKSYIRKKAKAKPGEYVHEPVWVKWPEEMMRKAVIRRHAKSLPKTQTVSSVHLNKIIELDSRDYRVINDDDTEQIEGAVKALQGSELAQAELAIVDLLDKLPEEEAATFREMCIDKRNAGEFTIDFAKNLIEQIKEQTQA